jgi:hypothetical protein
MVLLPADILTKPSSKLMQAADQLSLPSESRQELSTEPAKLSKELGGVHSNAFFPVSSPHP